MRQDRIRSKDESLEPVLCIYLYIQLDILDKLGTGGRFFLRLRNQILPFDPRFAKHTSKDLIPLMVYNSLARRDDCVLEPARAGLLL